MSVTTGSTYRDINQDWQIGTTSVVERAKHLLMTGQYTDCQFLVGDNGSNLELIRAHKIYLAQSSPVFEAMLFGKMTEGTVTNEVISIQDLTPSSFKDLLEYIYTDNVDLQSIDQAMILSYAAKKYILPDLVAKCVQYMMNNLCPEYTCRLLEFSNLLEDEKLKAECLSWLRVRTVESLAPTDFEELSESTVLSIVKGEALNIRELEMFKAIIRWAGHQCAQKDLEINGTNMRQMLGEIIGEIRFLAMEPGEFASSPALSGILTQEESFAILMNLNNPGSLPMPLHLSSCNNERSALISRRENGERSSTITDGIYCLRKVENEALDLKEPISNLISGFMVDKEIVIKGIVFAGMILADQQVFNGHDKILNCHLLNTDDDKLATAKVSQPLSRHVTPVTLEAVFNHPVHLLPNIPYRISVSVSQRAHFITGMSRTVSCQGVTFRFSSHEGGRLVRGFVFNLC